MWRCEKLDGVRFNYPTEKLAKWYVLLVHPGFHPLLCIICAHFAIYLRGSSPVGRTSSFSTSPAQFETDRSMSEMALSPDTSNNPSPPASLYPKDDTARRQASATFELLR